MRRTRVVFLLCAVILLLGTAGTGSAQTTGYWQYVRTDSGIQTYRVGTAYPDTHSGVEGNFTVTIAVPGEASVESNK